MGHTMQDAEHAARTQELNILVVNSCSLGFFNLKDNQRTVPRKLHCSDVGQLQSERILLMCQAQVYVIKSSQLSIGCTCSLDLI